MDNKIRFVSPWGIDLMVQDVLDVPQLTVENSEKWHHLYIVYPNGVIEEVTIDVIKTLDENWKDTNQTFHPELVRDIAKVYSAVIPPTTMELIVGRYVLTNEIGDLSYFKHLYTDNVEGNNTANEVSISDRQELSTQKHITPLDIFNFNDLYSDVELWFIKQIDTILQERFCKVGSEKVSGSEITLGIKIPSILQAKQSSEHVILPTQALNYYYQRLGWGSVTIKNNGDNANWTVTLSLFPNC